MTNRARVRRTVGLASWFLLLGGCSSDSHDVGEGLAFDRSRLDSYAASWDGYTEAYEFGSGSDRVRIELDENGNGTIRFGDVEPIAPATDPDTGYPVADPIDFASMGGGPIYGIYEAFVYSVVGARIEDERIRLDVDTNEFYSDWCELQTPVLDTVNSTPMNEFYSCVANTGYTTNDGVTCYALPDGSVGGMAAGGTAGMPGAAGEPAGGVPIGGVIGVGGASFSCAKYELCTRAVCACTADGCTSFERLGTSLDAALDDDGMSLEGTLILDDERVTVRLERQ